MLYKLYGADPKKRSTGIRNLVALEYAKKIGGNGTEKMVERLLPAEKVDDRRVASLEKENKELKSALALQRKTTNVFYTLFTRIINKFKEKKSSTPNNIAISFDEYKGLSPSKEELDCITNAKKDAEGTK
jgi:hypothetical protein